MIAMHVGIVELKCEICLGIVGMFECISLCSECLWCLRNVIKQ